MELVELNMRRHSGQVLLRFLVDRVGGVTVQDCAILNQRIGQSLDLAGTIAEGYTLEVSSPGLDRPLATKRDFERALGEEIEVELDRPMRELRQLKGQLLSVQDEAIVLITRLGNLAIPFEQITRAKKALQW
ncbi:MAG: ribosome maturation factor RimP [Candidatus Omnitrophica bacterium]|nr:ribosome maturation factor RimP [Candidatus Omnitrophota bacterium]